MLILESDVYCTGLTICFKCIGSSVFLIIAASFFVD